MIMMVMATIQYICTYTHKGLPFKKFTIVWVLISVCNSQANRGKSSITPRPPVPLCLLWSSPPTLATGNHGSLFCLCCYAFSITSYECNNINNTVPFLVWLHLLSKIQLRAAYIVAVSVLCPILLLSSMTILQFTHSPSKGSLGFPSFW